MSTRKKHYKYKTICTKGVFGWAFQLALGSTKSQKPTIVAVAYYKFYSTLTPTFVSFWIQSFRENY